MRILLVEDDRNTAAALWHGLKERYTFDCVFSSKEALARIECSIYDVLIVESGLPGINGIELCRQLRHSGCCIPILILTRNLLIEEKIAALDAGADDVLIKPISINELQAHLRALTRRGQLDYNLNLLRAGDVMMNLTEGAAYHGGIHLDLHRKEFLLLEYFLRHVERVMTRDMLLEHVWESSADPVTNTVDVHVKFLRDKLDKPFASHHICTLYGLGYKFAVQDGN